MPKAVNITLPFRTPVGFTRAIHLQHNSQCGAKAHLSVTVEHRVYGSSIDAFLSVDHLHQLTDGLMDCIHAIERNTRLENKDL